MTREIGSRKKLLHRGNFWERMLEALAGCQPGYVTYSYQEKADEYHLPLNQDLLARLREDSRLLVFSATAAQLAGSRFDSLALFTAR